ncbi:NAD(P)-dependent alcohol dehydrogenase [bacterium]|nr:NAD(P)-dependent alcohol dehydrogenase [bacterium]
MRYFSIESEFGIDRLKLSERGVPRPRHGQVLVQMRAASLNYRDLLVVEGNYTHEVSLPLVPISDGAGEVCELGPGVSRWKLGDRVVGTFFQDWDSGDISENAPKTALGGAIDGVLSEYVIFREEGLIEFPKDLSFEEASTLPCAALTAWHALKSGRLTCGQTVLTLGTGGVSIFALQFAKASGAKVISTTGSQNKMEHLKVMGANEVINYKSQPNWENRVWELTQKKGVDQVIEVGGAGTLGKSLKAVRMGGHISLIGVLSGAFGEVNPMQTVMKCVRIQGIHVGSRTMFKEMNKAIEINKIRPAVDRVFRFSETKEAYRYLKSGSHFGKVVIKIGDLE